MAYKPCFNIAYKISFTTLFIIFSIHINAQLIIDSNIVKKYHSEYKKIKEEYRTKIENLARDTQYKEPYQGIYFFSKYNIDTLNKKDYQKSSIKIVDIDSIEKTETEEIIVLDSRERQEVQDESPVYLPDFFCGGFIENDTLALDFGLSTNFELKIYKGKIRSAFKTDYSKNLESFSISLTGEKTNQLNISNNITHLTLNTAKYKIGETIFGEAEIETAPFYFFDAYDFKKGYIHQKLHVIFLFNVKLASMPKQTN